MNDEVRAEEYRTLAEIRHQLRRFHRFSELAAVGAGLTGRQHQAMLAICASEGGLLIRELADRMFLRAHTITELVDRLEKSSLVKRVQDRSDRRKVRVSLTEQGLAVLASLSDSHRAELREVGPLLSQLMAKL